MFDKNDRNQKEKKTDCFASSVPLLTALVNGFVEFNSWSENFTQNTEPSPSTNNRELSWKKENVFP